MARASVFSRTMLHSYVVYYTLIASMELFMSYFVLHSCYISTLSSKGLFTTGERQSVMTIVHLQNVVYSMCRYLILQ